MDEYSNLEIELDINDPDYLPDGKSSKCLDSESQFGHLMTCVKPIRIVSGWCQRRERDCFLGRVRENEATQSSGSDAEISRW